MNLFAKTQRSLFLPFVLLAVLCCDSVHSFSQMPQWNWALQVHGNREDPINFFDADNFGNTLIVGEIYSTAITIGDAQLVRTSEYIADGYIAVLNNEGDLNWARKIYNIDDEYVQHVYFRSATFDDHGNVLITGWFFSGNLFIDSTILLGGDKISIGFALKFDPNGILIWSHLYEEGVNPNAVVCDKKGGFYFLGGMADYCTEIDLGDIILENTAGQNQTFIVHYNNDNNADWAKLLLGFSDEIEGVTNELGDLCFWGQFEGLSYTIDSITLNNPEYNYQDYFGICNNSGKILCARTFSDDPLGIYSMIFKKDSVYAIGAFAGSSIMIEDDTLIEVPGGFETKFMSIFNYEGQYEYTTLFASDFPYLYNITPGKNNTLNIGAEIYSPFWTGIDTLENVNGSFDPAVIYLDADLNKIGGFSIPMTYDNSVPNTMTDPFGNMIFICSFKGDTLIFGEDTLKNYQLQSQRDYYVAKSGECDNTEFDISLIGGNLYAIDGIAWQWFADDILITGATSQFFFPGYSAFYRVRASLENGCYAWSNPYNYFYDGATNNPDEINMFIFPNPGNNIVNILISEPFDELTIYNVTGQKIASWGTADQLTTVFSYPTPGIYFAYVTKNEIQTCIKIVIL